MNRIYKVIYSKARQCYIVVSELAKSNHKSSQQGADRTNTPALARIIAVALAAGALTWGSVPEVSWAADTGQADTGQNATTIQGGIHYFSVNPEGGNRNKNYENDGAVGDDSLAVGAGAHADGRMGATALGNDAVAYGERALAVGNGSKATGLDAIAIGTGSQGEATGTNAIAIGEQSHAKGMYTTTVGSYSEATAEGAVAREALHAVHTRRGRAAPGPLQQLLHGGGGPGDGRLHRSVAAVAHPAPQAEAARRPR